MQLRHITQHETSPQPRRLLLNGTAIAKQHKLGFFLTGEKNATLPHCHTSCRDDGSAYVQKSPQPRHIAPKSVTVVFPAAVNASESEACSAISQTKIAHLKAQTLMLSPPSASCLATHGCIMGSQRHALSPQKIIQKVQLSQRRKTSWQLRPCHLLRMKLLQEAICLSHSSRQKCRTNSLASEHFIAKTYVILIYNCYIFSLCTDFFKILCLWVAITRMFSGTSNSQTFVQSKAQPQQRLRARRSATKKAGFFLGSPTAPRPWTAWPCRGLESWETWPFWPLTVGKVQVDPFWPSRHGNSRNRMCMCPYLYYIWLYIYITYFTHRYICTVYT